jgi:hypothetical protein
MDREPAEFVFLRAPSRLAKYRVDEDDKVPQLPEIRILLRG